MDLDLVIEGHAHHRQLTAALGACEQAPLAGGAWVKACFDRVVDGHPMVSLSLGTADRSWSDLRIALRRGQPAIISADDLEIALTVR
ncbi:MAG: hypothetical protein R2939_10555 [Kofleriaceae bacterium]